jgi:outer membrane protein TolC
LLSGPLLVLSLATLEAAAADPVQLTRETAVAMAIRKNIDLRVEALNSAIAESNLAQSRAIYNPILSTSASTGKTTFPGEDFRTSSSIGTLGLTQYLPTGGSISASTQAGYTTAESDNSAISTEDWQSSVGLTISHPLLKNAGKKVMELNITLAGNSLEDSLERFRFFLADTVFSVVTSYNRLYSLRRVLESRQAALASVQDLLKEIRENATPGQLQRVEVANAEYALAQRRKDLVDAERNLRDQEAHLRYLVGMEEKTPIIPVDPPSREEPPESQKQALATALESRADLKQLRLSLESALLQEQVARHQVLPDLSMIASGGFSGIDGSIGNSFQQIGQGEGAWWSAGLQFTLPLGNSAAKNYYRQSRLRTEQLRNQISAFEWQVNNSVESDMRSLISARLQLQTNDQSVRFAEERLAEYRNQRKAGTGSVQDVLNAENDLIAARNAQSDATETFAYAVAFLWRDIGVLLERLNIQVDSSDPETLTRRSPQAEVRMAGDVLRPPVVPPSPPPPPGPEKAVTATPGPSRQDTPVAPAETTITEPAAPPAQAVVPGPSRTVETEGPIAGFTLKIDVFVTNAALAEVQKVLKEAGLTPVLQYGPKKTGEVIRLLTGSYSSQKAALEKIDALRRIKADSFFLRGKGGFKVYAGSYILEKGARSEQKRLASLGVKTTLEKASVNLPTYRLTAGTFDTREAADATASRLATRGLQARVVAIAP